MILQTRKFPKDFMYHAYASFHSHLPEELFFEDFSTFFNKANALTFKAFSSTFEKCDNLDEQEREEEMPADPLKIMQETISK
jgi:hypothetical protein